MTPTPFITRHSREHAFSLVATLIIIAMLAVVVVGFMASMGNERATASAFASKTKADQAAQAGVDSAMAMLRESFRDFPDSATVWEAQSKSDDGKSNEGTSLYVHAVPDQTLPNQPDPTASGSGTSAQNLNSPSNLNSSGVDARSTFVLPLVSGASWQLLASPITAVDHGKALVTEQNKAPGFDPYLFTPNINVRRSSNDSQGWLGSPPDYFTTNPAPVTPKPVRVPWVEITQPEGTTKEGQGTVVGRYAFWVEDESFRANVNYAGMGDNSSGTPTLSRRDNTTNLPLNAADLDLRGPLTALGVTDTAPAQSIFDTRKLYPGLLFPDPMGYSHAPKITGTTFADSLRFLTTTFSGALNLSRHGTQRLNLNELLYPATANTYTAQNQIDNIVGTIFYHAPKFGQRFYRNTTATSTASDPNSLDVTDNGLNKTDNPNSQNHSLIYLYKIATNIVDYMDSDPRPTFVSSGVPIPGAPNAVGAGQVYTGPFPNEVAFSGPTPLWAQGKDSAPFLEEGAVRFRRGPLPGGTAVAAGAYQLYVDYYLEFYNMTGRDIAAADLGANLRLKVSNPPPWIGDYVDSGGNSSSHETYLTSTDSDNVSPSDTRRYPMPNGQYKGNGTLRDYSIDLGTHFPNSDIPINYSDVIFKAGVATVITTDPDAALNNTRTETTRVNLLNKDGLNKDIMTNVIVRPFVYKTGGKREFNGPMPMAAADAKNPARLCTRLRIPSSGNYTSTSSSDYETNVVLLANEGYIDCLEGAIPMNQGFLITDPGNPTNPVLLGGSLRGNSANFVSTTGDPRTNNEQMNYIIYQSGGALDQSRYFNFTYTNNLSVASTPPYSGLGTSDSSLGKPNVNYIAPEMNTGGYTPWPDYYKFVGPYGDVNGSVPIYTKIAANAPAVIANAPLTSIGQLGDVFDPARYSGGNLLQSRGGGRTLKIGQHDDRWDGNQLSASRGWASWRLTDFFSAPPPSTTGTLKAGPFPDTMFQPGLINVNGVARDNGAALRAALTGLNMQPAPLSTTSSTLYPLGDPQLSGKPINVAATDVATTGIQAMITEIKQRLKTTPGSSSFGPDQFSSDETYLPRNTGTGPFFERGELSELTQFGRNTPAATFPPTVPYKATKLTGSDMSTVFDRGREEIFRRLVDMTTTRGNVFTVYAVGQSIKQVDTTKSKVITGTQRLKVTFQLVPKTSSGEDFHPATDRDGKPVRFDLTQNSGLNSRFMKPDHYDIQILASSRSGG